MRPFKSQLILLGYKNFTVATKCLLVIVCILSHKLRIRIDIDENLLIAAM